MAAHLRAPSSNPYPKNTPNSDHGLSILFSRNLDHGLSFSFPLYAQGLGWSEFRLSSGLSEVFCVATPADNPMTHKHTLECWKGVV